MALIECPECGGQVSDKADACPKCSHPMGAKRQDARNNLILQRICFGIAGVGVLVAFKDPGVGLAVAGIFAVMGLMLQVKSVF